MTTNLVLDAFNQAFRRYREGVKDLSGSIYHSGFAEVLLYATLPEANGPGPGTRLLGDDERAVPKPPGWLLSWGLTRAAARRDLVVTTSRLGGCGWQMTAGGADRLLTTGQVAALFGVKPENREPMGIRRPTGMGRHTWRTP
jgi:hypothetical protein